MEKKGFCNTFYSDFIITEVMKTVQTNIPLEHHRKQPTPILLNRHPVFAGRNKIYEVTKETQYYILSLLHKISDKLLYLA